MQLYIYALVLAYAAWLGYCLWDTRRTEKVIVLIRASMPLPTNYPILTRDLVRRVQTRDYSFSESRIRKGLERLMLRGKIDHRYEGRIGEWRKDPNDAWAWIVPPDYRSA